MKNRKALLLLFILLLPALAMLLDTTPTAKAVGTEIASYSEANVTNMIALRSNITYTNTYPAAIGEVFQTPAYDVYIGSASFYLQRVGNPDGQYGIYIFPITGTYGSTAMPTGNNLDNELAHSGLAEGYMFSTSQTKVTLTFNGAEKIKLTASTYYAVAFVKVTGNSGSTFTASNYISVGVDSSGEYAGNMFIEAQGGWQAGFYEDPAYDSAFYVYTEGAVSSDSCSLNTQAGYEIAGTKTLLAGKYDYIIDYTASDEDGGSDIFNGTVILDYGNRNVALQAFYNGVSWGFSELSDPSNYVTLNASASWALTVGYNKEFHFYVKINWNWGSEGETINVRGIATDEVGASDAQTFSNVFGVLAELTPSTLAVNDYRCNPAQSLTFTGELYYTGTAYLCPDGNFNVAIKLGSTTKGTDTTLVSGAFSASVSAESTVGSYSYTAECSYMTNSGSFSSVIVDRLIVSIAASDTSVYNGAYVGFVVSAKYDYDDTAVTTLSSTTLLNGFPFSSANVFSDTSASATVNTYTPNSASETVYGLNTFSLVSSVEVTWIGDFVTTGSGNYYFRGDTTTIMDELGYKLQTINTNSQQNVTESITENWVYLGIRVWYYDMFNATHEITSGTPDGVALATDTGGSFTEFIGYWNCPTVAVNQIDHIKIVMYVDIDDTWIPEAIFLSPSGSDDIQNYIVIKNCTADVHYYANVTAGESVTIGFGDSTNANAYINLNVARADPWSVSYARFGNRDFFGAITVPWTWVVGNLFWSILFLMLISTIIIKHGSFKLAILLCWIMGGSGSILWAIVPESGLVVAAIMLAAGMGGTLFKIFHR